MKVALIQTKPTPSAADNLSCAANKVKECADRGAAIAVLPEMFCCPYDTRLFTRYAQADGGERFSSLSRCAAQNHIYLVAGSLPECSGGKVYNTSYVFSPSGELVCKHRKVHLYDVAFKGGTTFCESDSICAGDQATVFDTEYGRFALMVCFDVRFAEFCRVVRNAGAVALFAPASFNMTSGPRWWELVFRARAVDNQMFTFGCATARDESASYVSWGHSIAVSPLGDVLGELDEKEGELLVDVDLSLVEEAGHELPLLSQRRGDLYEVVWKGQRGCSPLVPSHRGEHAASKGGGMSKYKLIAVDMDGTLLDSQKRIGERTLEAIERALDSGKQVAISTGRCLAEMRVYLDDLSHVRYFVCASGAIVYDMAKGVRVHEQLMAPDVATRCMQVASIEGAMIHVMSDESIVQRDQQENMSEYGMGVYKPLYDRVTTQVDDIRSFFASSPFAVAKLNLYHRTTESRLRTRERLATVDVELADSERTSLECSAHGVTKASGVKALCRILGIGMEEVIAVGDADNDLALLKEAGLSVAMGNASDRLKACCDVTVADCDAQGCAEAIERFLL